LEAIINENLDVPALICAKPAPASKTESGRDIFYACLHFYVYPYFNPFRTARMLAVVDI
jgi:hypothetical protein